MICTTPQATGKRKLIDDIKKLSETDCSSKISEVVICSNFPLKDEREKYHETCREKGWDITIYSLNKLTKATLTSTKTLRKYAPGLEEEKEQPAMRSIFFCAGARLKEVREDINLSTSRIIEIADFHSEAQWRDLEHSSGEFSEDVLLRISSDAGVSMSWLKHGEGQKYPIISIQDSDTHAIDAIKAEGALGSYMVIEPDTMRIALMVKITDRRWIVGSFLFSLDFWNWVGDQHHIPTIYQLLDKINKELSPSSRIVNNATISKILDGKVHPGEIFRELKNNSYWFDDMFDVHQKYPISKTYSKYGQWFIKLQNHFRAALDTKQTLG